MLTVFENSIAMSFAVIPSGEFRMGSNRPSVRFRKQREKGRLDSQPVHTVRLDRVFLLGRTQVTNRQWQIVMGDVPSVHKCDNKPVTNVSWDDAIAFCNALSALSAEREAKRTYRLPTEAQWEYACRAGSKKQFCFGNKKWDTLKEYAWFDGNTFLNNERFPHAVATRKPNAWGLYDMHGNVSEWCSDWYVWYSADVVCDPQGPVETPRLGSYRRKDQRILKGSGFPWRTTRGGSFSDTWYHLLSSARGRRSPSFKGNGVGFRVAVSLVGIDNALAESQSPPVNQLGLDESPL